MEVAIVIGVLLVVGFLFLMAPRADIAGEEARKRVAAGALLVDVRSRGEFASGHLAGAVNIPVNELGERLKELGKADQAIVLYCASGARSGRAAAMLRGKGYREVANLGAMSRW